MKDTQIQNFVKNQTMEISHMMLRGYAAQPLVQVLQGAGSMNFQFSMTPDQARHMAAALIAHADTIEDEAAAKSTPATV